jgi:serine/threonine protein kinase/Flp pilus assembly protein TadD
MIGSTISHYKIIEKLGEGGMGVVYKAQDLKLDRFVALKFLPPEMIRDPGAKERFVHEAKSASALDHPNICTIHEIGETSDGQLFIAMACYEGKPLNEKIARGAMRIEEAVDIAIQVAQGLQKAHEKGITHRDVKSGNIIITNDGVVKILDFGLAKLAGQSRLTKTGSTIGTAAYMSPEQAQGLEVDHRTDIWSLGIVLFEMLTGKLPFRGEHEAALLYAIVHEEPQAVASFRSDIPGGVLMVIGKALQKDSSKRYQTAKDMVTDLKSGMTTAPPRQEKSIVVLPFENLSPDPDQEYFSDGLTEEVISDLCAVRSLRVISRSSAMTFKGTKKKLPDIAREVGVQYVLEGSVRKAGNNLRITAQLIDATNDAHVWADKYSGTLDDIFVIQERVSRSIVDTLKIQLTSEESRRLVEQPIPHARAFEWFLSARQALYRGDQASIANTIQKLNDALTVVGDNELLYASLGYTYLRCFRVKTPSQVDLLDQAAAYSKKVFALNPSSSHGHALNGMLQMIFGNVQDSVRAYKQALARDPNNSEALFWLTVDYLYAGKRNAALSTMEKLLRIDPLNPQNYFIKGGIYTYDGDFDDGLREARYGYQMDPASPIARWLLIVFLVWSGRHEEAFGLIDRLANDAPTWPYAQQALFLKHGLLGEVDKIQLIDSESLEFESRYDQHFSLHVAECYALINDRNHALDLLENAVEKGMICYPFLSQYDPLLENLRGEQRFKTLMERVKKEWEEFEV